MKVFGFPASPFVRKVHVVAAEKGIEIEPVLFDPRNPPAEFLAASPFRKIPALQDGECTLADSTAIVTYLEALQPDPALLPSDPATRGRAIWFEEFADTILAPASGPIMFNRFVAPRLMGKPGDEEAAALGEKDIAPLLDWLNTAVRPEGWLAGPAFSIGDIAVASVLRTLSYVGLGPDAATHPATAAWYDRVISRTAWTQVEEREEGIVKAAMRT